MTLLPITCRRCGQGPDLHLVKSKYTGDRLYLCAECLGMWRSLDTAITGGDEGFLNHNEYLRSVGRPDHYLDAQDYESWTTEDWDKYNEPWINCDAEFNAQQESSS